MMDNETIRAAREAYIAALRTEIERLTAELAAVEGTLDGSAGGPLVPAQRAIQVGPATFFGMTTPQATRRFLEMMGRENPQTPQAIAEALVRGGMDKTENLDAVVNNVYTALKRGRNKQFVKIGRTWGLSDLYRSPRKRNGQRKTAPPAEPETAKEKVQKALDES